MAEINKITGDHYTNSTLVWGLLKNYGIPQATVTDMTTDDMLGLADAYIDSNTFRDFKLHTNTVEFYHGNGKDNITTYHFPIVRISRVIMYNQLLQAMRTFLDTELIIYPDRGQIFLPPIYPAFMTDKPFMAIFGNIFIPGNYNIEVDYDYGYATPPADIQLAATKYTAIQILTAYGAQLSYGMTARTIDGYSESFGKLPYEGLVNVWQKEVDGIIARNKRVYGRAI